KQECWTSHVLVGTAEYPTCDGSTMKTARRASWTSAPTVASPDTTLSPREQAASSSGTIGRVKTSSPTTPATVAAIRVAASPESVSPKPAVKPKIPAAKPTDEATSARIIVA